jgi:beta-lactam-binding protein with PASTA domain
MNYVIIEVANRNTPKGLVMSQSPGAGARAGPDSAVTLLVSAGVPQ